MSNGVKDSLAQEIIEHYFDREPYEGEAIARQTMTWLAFEYANGLMSERVFMLLVWQSARRIGYSHELAKIRASIAVAAFSNLGCNCRDSSESQPDNSGLKGGSE